MVRPRVSVIVATRERNDLLAATLPATSAQLGEGDELLVVESGQGDASELVAGLGRHARYVRVDGGKTVALNAAAQIASGEVLVFTDDDVDVADGWVDGLASPFVGAPRLGAAFGPVAGLGDAPLPEVPPGPAPVEVWVYAHGPSMAVRRAALLDVGGFDERLGPGGPVGHGEEADLVLRLRERGWTIAVAGAPTAQHVGWRSSAERAANTLVYERGAGTWVGAALRRNPRAAAKVAALRLRHQVTLLRDRRFGTRALAAFARGLAAGLLVRPRRFLAVELPGALEADASDRPRLLWVTAEPPGRHLGGGHIRQAHLVAGLVDRFDVTVLSAGAVADVWVRRAAAIIEVPAGRVLEPRTHTAQRLRNLWVALVRRQPLEVWVGRRHRRSLQPVLEREAPRHDAVAINHQVLFPFARSLGDRTLVLETQNVASVRAVHQAAAAAGRRQRWLWSREAAVSRRFEDAAIASADAVVVCSDDDAVDLAGPGGSRARGPVIVAPNGVDLDVHRPTPLPAEPVIVLTATLDYQPNVDGLLWFVDHILGVVAAAVPDVRLVVAGRRPPPAVLALAQDAAIDVHADVPTVVPFIERARVGIVPIRAGTGTRLKALEYLASARPVVGTTIGLAGIGVRHDEHALVADDPGEFAAWVVAVLSDDALAARISSAGRAHVEAGFSWSAIARRHADDLAAVVSDAGGHARRRAGHPTGR